MAETGNLDARPRRSFLKAFRPLFIWLGISLVLVGGYYYCKYSSQTVVMFRLTVDGQTPTMELIATLDGKPYRPGLATKSGTKNLVVMGDGLEPVERNVSVRFGRKNDLGVIDLTRQKGGLEINVVPAPKEIRLTGNSAKRVVAGSTAKFPSLLVGNYQVEAEFDTFREQREVQIRRNATTKLDFKPNAGFALIAAEPPDASFRLTGNRSGIYLDGTTPKNLFLPAGDYELSISRGDYHKQVPVHITASVSNDVIAKFEYGEINFATTPPGATIHESFKTIGRTPFTLSQVKPGDYHFRFELPDYNSVGVKVTISGNESVSISTNLVNRRFTAAFENARRELERSKPNYQAALAKAEEALAVTPGDPAALELKGAIESAIGQQAARVRGQKQATTTEREGQAQANAKVISLADVFQKEAQRVKDSELFDTHVWTFASKSDAVREAVLRTLKDPFFNWQLEPESRLNQDTFIFRATDTSLNSRRRRCLVLVGQTAPGEAVVYAKFWEYLLKNTFSISIGNDPSAGPNFVPVHTNYYNPKTAEMRRKVMAEGFKKDIEKRLK